LTTYKPHEYTTTATTVTVVIPTRNEAGNVAPLVERLIPALGDTDAEIVFVDDSNDDTPVRIAEVAGTASRAVRLLRREPHERAGGLGSAVLAGLQSSNATWAVVMDGDLQHPPEIVPELVRTGEALGADVVVASRYVASGSASGLSSAARGWVSRASTGLAKAAFPRRLHGCSDPMSGFFAVRLASLDTATLHPSGFKILLEILARSRRLRVGEYPFTFGERHSGDSKASWREGVLFLRRLLSLRFATLFGRHSTRVAKIGGFAAVGVTGALVNTFALWTLVDVLGSPLLLAACLATQVSTGWNFALIDRLVYRGPKDRAPWQRLLGFAVVNNLALLARLPLLGWLVRSVGVNYLIANIVTLLAAFVVRFLLSDRFLFTRGGQMTIVIGQQEQENIAQPAPEEATVTRSGPVDLVVDLREDVGPTIRRRGVPMPYCYDVHGILTIRSAVRLAELDHFRGEIGDRADIEIEPGQFQPGRVRARPRVTQYAARPAVSYEEHLGRAGSDFFIDMSEDNIRIVVGPMLVRSPHVLYTNIVEALLRFVLVSRGYMLLHSACLDFGGHGVLLSALTDTGKTGTVLRLLREHGGRFLSDDMTIIDGHGLARCYPKPLTISQHTLRAVNAGDLTPKEWRLLKVQSRIHSKEGRGIGARLGEINVPIMSLNALTQRIVPPPKYTVQRLVPCELVTSVEIDSLFVIERDEHRIADIDPELLVDELIANTDDAYGFPPFRYLAPAFVIGGEGYEELRARERAILVSAMSGVRARRVATPNFSWADYIPHLVRAVPTRSGADANAVQVSDEHPATSAGTN
jgi:dolichol-phosphate mannosyltransferase